MKYEDSTARIAYRKGNYKYQLEKTYVVQTSIYPEKDIKTKFIELTRTGKLTIIFGYGWDGCSGPTIDTKSNMRGSLGHDAIFQLIRRGYLDRSWFKEANKEFRKVCREDGMGWLRSQLYRGVRFSKFATSKDQTKQVQYAP
jgi:hypothetical protein